MDNSAAVYNNIKDICLSIYHQRWDLQEIFQIIANYKEQGIDSRSIAGLKGEFIFYDLYRRQYLLTPTNDHGVKADFVGLINGLMYRIDVTTNAKFKKKSDYDWLLKITQISYAIAEIDIQTLTLNNIIFWDVSKPVIMTDKTPSLPAYSPIDIAIFMPAEYNRHGECRNNPYQQIVTINLANPCGYVEQEIVTDWYLPDIGTYTESLYEGYYEDNEINPNSIKTQVNQYLRSAAKLLSESTGRNILACGYIHTEFEDPRTCEEEYKVIKIEWADPAISEYIPDRIDYEEEWDYNDEDDDASE